MKALNNHHAAGICTSKMLFYDNPGVIDRTEIFTQPQPENYYTEEGAISRV